MRLFWTLFLVLGLSLISFTVYEKRSPRTAAPQTTAPTEDGAFHTSDDGTPIRRQAVRTDPSHAAAEK